MSKPIRVQRQRRKGWRMPENTVYVGRPSKWENPYPVGCVAAPTHADAVALYKHFLKRWPELIEDAKEELSGKNLACWCAPDKPCHADVLLEIANG